MTRVILAGLFVFILTFLVFSETKNFDFLNFDDNEYVIQNPHVNTGLNQTNITWAFTQSHAGHYHPLTWVSHQIDVTLFKLNPRSHHLVSVFIHSVNALLLFTLLFRLFGSVPLAFLFSLLFALHPQRIESVAWIAERKDVLSVFFGLMTLLAYESYSRHKKKLTYSLTLVFFCLGLLAKPSLVIFPFLLILFDFWPLKKPSPSLKNKIPFFLLSFLFSLVVFFAQKEVGALQNLNTLSITDRIYNGFVGYLIYFGKTFWPQNLGIFYPLTSYPLWLFFGSITVFLMMSFFAFHQRKKAPWIFFGWAWFVISLLPVIGFIQIGWQSMADRWSYLPHLGFAIALCGFLATTLTLHRNKIYVVLTLVLILSIYKTKTELPHWKNSESIFTHTVEISRDNFLAHTHLADALVEKGDYKKASDHYEKALRIHPYYVEALNNLGKLKAIHKNYSQAIPLFKKALIKNPNDLVARYNLGLATYYQGEKINALIEWVHVYKQNPSYTEVRSSLNYMMKKDSETICKTANNEQKKTLLTLFEKIKSSEEPSDDLKISLKKIYECLK